MSLPDAFVVSAERVPARLAELARIGASATGGITRLPFSQSEAEAVLLFSEWARMAGATVVRDAFGNVFALRGDWNRDPAIMLGSHLDTVVDGGAYDGALGVVAALAVLESWDDKTPICAAAFRAEEATQAGQGRVGSSVYTNTLSLAEAMQLFGDDPNDTLEKLPAQDVAFPRLYLELHVEQGPTLEIEDCTIGAVTGIAGYARWRATTYGKPDHVGTASMSARRDALAAAAEIILNVERVGREMVDVASVGLLEVSPNRVGIVPARATLTADVRCLDDQRVEAAIAELDAAAVRVCRRRSLDVEADTITRVGTVRFAYEVVDAVVAAARAIGARVLRLPSGANHDARNLASVCSAGMVFVPSRDGQSHAPDEFTAPSECEAGTIVLGLAASSLVHGS